MATGDRICPYCNQWAQFCTCNAGTARHSPWLPFTVSWNPPQLTALELAEVRGLLSRIRERERTEPGWIDRVFGTPERFGLETKASHELSEVAHAANRHT